MTIKQKEQVISARPILKWAGGKTQLLPKLIPLIPKGTQRYIEPFIGGGALFFATAYRDAVISDSNAELINLYQQVASNLNGVLDSLEPYQNDEELFYEVRSYDWQELPPEEAAARTIFLNKTCFNGLYRVNRSGGFNVPFGKYKNPNICDTEALTAASQRLKGTSIIHGDYQEVLLRYARQGDFIFLDPPYVPLSSSSDFKRYTKEQFYEKDQVALARLVHDLFDKGCNLVLTNSNHPLVHELYAGFKIEVHATKRHINCRGNKRQGEDVIVIASHNS